jgi:hypothetical protein
VVCGRLHLMLVDARGYHGAHNARAACLLADVTVVVGRDCGLLVALLAPLLAALGALLGGLDGVVGQGFPAAAWGRVKLGCLVADGVLGGHTAPLLDGARGDVRRCLERPQQWYVTRAPSRHPNQWPPRFMAGPPSPTWLIVM